MAARERAAMPATGSRKVSIEGHRFFVRTQERTSTLGGDEWPSTSGAIAPRRRR